MASHDQEYAPTGRWVAERVIRLLYEILRGTSPDAARADLAGLSVGVVTALKLLVRLETCGSIVLTAAPEGIDAIESMSDELAEEYFDELAGDVFGTGTLQARLSTDRFARTDNTLAFRFAPSLAMGETSPDELQDITLTIADSVLARMMALLERTMGTLDEKAVVIGKM